MRTKSPIDLKNIDRLEKASEDGVYALPTKPSKVKDDITRRKIQELKRRSNQ